MSLHRLSFLYPHLYKSSRAQGPSIPSSPLRIKQRRSSRSNFTTVSQHQEETFPKRYGTAAEPQPLPVPSSDQSGRTETLADTIEKEVKAPGIQKQEKKTSSSQSRDESASIQDSSEKISSKTTKSPPNDAVASGSSPNVKPSTISREILIKPMERLSQLEVSTTIENEENKPHHLQAPLYVHHFDTYTIVRDLKKGGFTHDQSVTLTKAIRSLLGVNLDIARENLVSKSDVENATYLFRAACSELRTEILNARKASTNKMASQRAHLQHEVDILSQKASQEALTLKDDLRGMLNDRRMDVRMEQQARESAIQELNYKITVSLNSDSKSEIEGLRWILTRRAAMTIASMALLILGSLRYSSYKLHERQQRSQLSSSTSPSPPSNPGSSNNNYNNGGGGGNHPPYTVPAREAGTQTDALLASAEPLG